MMFRTWKRFSLLIVQLILVSILLSGCSVSQSKNEGRDNTAAGSIVLADAEWESIKIHNRIAGYIIEHGYGYQPNYLTGENLPLFKALNRGDADIMMEVWTSDYPELWKQMLKSGRVRILGTNFTGTQGWFIPAYMVEGDSERGIEPQIPELKSVQDLSAYQEEFKLSPSSNKGIVLNAPHDWPAAAINTEKIKGYHLDHSFSLLPSQAEIDLANSLDKAYTRGGPWLGYARDPSIITAGHKLFILREEPFNEDQWQLGRICAYPESNVVIAAHAGMNQKAPEILDFLQQYTSTRQQNEEMLIYLQKFEGNKEAAAQEWLLNNPDVWSQWVPEDIAQKIWADLNPTITKNN